MADITLTYKGDTIAELSETGSKTIETAGKYCEDDILLEYVKPQSQAKPFENINILLGKTYTKGYYDAYGSISTRQDASNQEWTIPKFTCPELAGEKLLFLWSFPNRSNTYMWFCVCEWAEDDTFLGRTVVNGLPTITINENTHSIGVSLRSNLGIAAALVKEEYFPVFQSLGMLNIVNNEVIT